MKNFPTIVPVVAIALLDRAGQVLMQRRRMSAEHGGLWEFPGGKVEVGETLEESLCREISEELDIVLDPVCLRPLSFAAQSDSRIVILLYTCRKWIGEPRCLDAEEIAWFMPQAILNLDMPPLDIPLARALLDHLKSTN